MDVFFDESGNTGANLSSDSQPIYALGSHSLSEPESRNLVERIFSRIPDRELKYTRLRKSPRGQARILSIIEGIDKTKAQRRGYVADKLFVLTTKLFDVFVEPALHDDGVNVYEHGWNITATLAMHASLLDCLGRDGLVQFHANLERLLRERDTLAFEAFWRVFEVGVARPAIGRGRDVLTLMLYYGQRMTTEDYLRLPDVLQIGPSLLVSELISWTENGSRRINPVHDESTIVTASASEIDYLRQGGPGQVRMGFEGGPNYLHPLPLGELRIEQSHNWVGLQIADILAGAYAEIARAASGYDYDATMLEGLHSTGFDIVNNNILFDPGWTSPFQGNPAGLDPIAHRAAISF